MPDSSQWLTGRSWIGTGTISAAISLNLSVTLQSNNTVSEEGAPTTTACEIFLRNIRETLSELGRNLYAVIIDYRAAFDSAPGNQVLKILAGVSVTER